MRQGNQPNGPGSFIPFSRLPLSDRFMFGEVMRHAEVCQLFLEAVLRKKIARIEYISKEEDLSDDPYGHGIRLDVYLQDAENSRYDVEMQNISHRALERRARYYQSGIDRRFLERGADYDELPESYVIFLCNFDYFRKGLACYERVSVLRDCAGIPYEDGSHVLFLNSCYTCPNVLPEVQEFLDYIRTNDDSASPRSDLTRKAREYVDHIRSDKSKEGVYMTYAMSLRESYRDGMQEGRREGHMEGRAEGVATGREEGIRAMIAALKELSVPQALVIQKLSQHFTLSAAQAEEKVLQYW